LTITAMMREKEGRKKDNPFTYSGGRKKEKKNTLSYLATVKTSRRDQRGKEKKRVHTCFPSRGRGKGGRKNEDLSFALSMSFHRTCEKKKRQEKGKGEEKGALLLRRYSKENFVISHQGETEGKEKKKGKEAILYDFEELKEGGRKGEETFQCLFLRLERGRGWGLRKK